MPRSNPHPYRVVVVRYYQPDGQRCRKADPGAVARKEQTSTYYADLPGKPRQSLSTDDLQLAWAALNKKLREQREEELGIADPAHAHARTSLAGHLDEWAAVLAAKGTGADAVQLVKNRLGRLMGLAGWKRLPDITADSALKGLAKVQTELGKSACTRNHYLGHLKAFIAWCHEGGRMKANPVRRLQPINTEADRRHARRCPAAEEIAELCRWLGTEDAPTRRGLAPQERRLGYLLSMATGFRAGELRALTREAFDLERGTVTVPAAYSKRRRRDTQELPGWLVEELKAWLDAGHGWGWGRLADKAAPGKMLKADLAAARAAWLAAGGTAPGFLCWQVDTPHGPAFFDFHSFRHAFVTHMASLPGMDLRTLLSLTRHSSPDLALKTYAHVQQERIRAAVDQLPPPGK